MHIKSISYYTLCTELREKSIDFVFQSELRTVGSSEAVQYSSANGLHVYTY